MTFKVLNFHFSISSFRILASFSSDPVLIFIPSGARQILLRTCVKPAASIESNADARKNKKKLSEVMQESASTRLRHVPSLQQKVCSFFGETEIAQNSVGMKSIHV